MSWAYRAKEFLIGGAGGIVVSLFYTMLGRSDGITAGDWLSFFGVFVGGGLGVAAGMAVERWKVGLQTRADLAASRAALAKIITGLEGFATMEAQAHEPRWPSWCRATSDGLLVLEVWLSRATLDDLELWADLINFHAQLPDAHSNLRRYLRNTGNDAAVVVPAVQDVMSCRALAERILDNARDLRGRL